MSALFERATGLVLRDPWFLALALLVPVAIWLRQGQREPAASFPLAGVVGIGGLPLPASWRVRLLPLPRILTALGILCAATALARPAARVEDPERAEGVDIVLCLDTSSSMTAKDLDGKRTRLEVAKDAATRFIAGRRDDRIGLVTFARFPDLRCPPTLDHDALLRILDDVATVPSDGPEDATGIGAATARAAQVLDGAKARSRVVILLTDGEENVATAGALHEIAPSHAAQLLLTLRVRAYAIAVGGGTADRQPVRRMAEATGGLFLEARDARGLDDVYAKIDALEKAPAAAPRFVLDDRFLPFLAAALAFLLSGRLLASTVLETHP